MFSSATNPIPTTYVLTESFCIAFCMKWPMSVSTVMYLVSLRTATMDMIHASARIFFVMWLMANRYATMHIKTVSYKRTEGRQKRGKEAAVEVAPFDQHRAIRGPLFGFLLGRRCISAVAPAPKFNDFNEIEGLACMRWRVPSVPVVR